MHIPNWRKEGGERKIQGKRKEHSIGSFEVLPMKGIKKHIK
jgi:hypothetical protein